MIFRLKNSIQEFTNSKMKVVFTKRAYCALLSEVAEKISTETGGLFLGHRVGDTWYVIETIDPGPNSVFQIAYFEYDQKYTTFLANKIARLYAKPLKLIGLWHRHPGSFDQFSSTDDGTNKKFAQQNGGHTISALVNIDPQFRLTVYHVSLPITYKPVSFIVDDNAIPLEFRELREDNKIIESIEHPQNSAVERRLENSISLKEVFKCAEPELNWIDKTKNALTEKKVLDDVNLDKILETLNEDIQFLSEMRCDLTLSIRENAVICKGKNVDDFFEIILNESNDEPVLIFGEKQYDYASGMIKSAYEKSEKRKLLRRKSDMWSSITCKILNLTKK